MASGPIPKFVNARGILRYELRNLRTTSNSMNRVRLLNLRFLNELAAANGRNLKFAAPGVMCSPARRNAEALRLRPCGWLTSAEQVWPEWVPYAWGGPVPAALRLPIILKDCQRFTILFIRFFSRVGLVVCNGPLASNRPPIRVQAKELDWRVVGGCH